MRIERADGRATVTDASGHTDVFDHVVIASHSDQALAMLAEPSAKERSQLGAVQYRPNAVYLHRDPALMPRRQKIWSSWNYVEQSADGAGDDVCVSYWMNRLQNISNDKPLFVTLNPTRPPRPDLTFGEYSYAHPQFDRAAINAQNTSRPYRASRTRGIVARITATGFTRTDCPRAFASQRRWARATRGDPMLRTGTSSATRPSRSQAWTEAG